MTDAQSFFEAILPSEGDRCLVVISTGRTRQRFFPSNELLSLAAREHDIEGAAVYHGCASYTGGKRTANNVHRIKALWADLDCGEGKSYATAREAAEAVLLFCRNVDVPVPLFVRSGTGLHVYWILDRELTREEWLPLAQGLKALCREHSLHIDPTRTADPASILRPPGSTHRKGEPVKVVAGPIPAPVSPEIFARFTTGAPALRVVASNPSSLAHRLANMRTTENVDANLLAERCAQLGLFRDTGGVLPEPQWYAGIGVLAFGGDTGEVAAHEWSRGHEGYSVSQTSERLRRARELTGPSTCKRFHELNPSLCEACPKWKQITTPLEVIYHAPKAVEEDDAPAPKPGQHPTDLSLPPSKRWVSDERGLGFIGDKGQRGKVCSFPIELVSVDRAEMKLHGQTYRLRYWQPHEGWQECTLSASGLFGSGAGAALSAAGITVHNVPLFQKYVQDGADALARLGGRSMQYEQFGWKNVDDAPAFLYGERLYKDGEVTGASVTNDLATRARRYMAPVRNGSVEGWKHAADALLFGKDAESVAFATLCSLAAPLMRFQEAHEGGSILALITRDSATSKTTSLMGAYTIWGSDRRALGVKVNDTQVSVGVNMGVLCNLPIIYDEFWKSDADALYNDVQNFTNGEDKARGARDGGLKHNASGWQTILMCASNNSLVGSLQSLNRPEAMAFRVIEMQVSPKPSGLLPSEADQIREQMHRNAGHVGDKFLRYLTRADVLPTVRKKLFETSNEIYRKGDFGREHRYWVRTLAAVSVAARLADHLDLMTFNSDRIINWGFDHLCQMKRSGTVTNDSKSFHLTMLSHFINEHRGEILEMPSAGSRAIGGNDRFMKRVIGRRDVDTGYYTLDKGVLRVWLQKRAITLNEFIRSLGSHKIVVGEKPMSLAAGTGLPSGMVHALIIDGDAPVFTGKPRLVKSAEENRAHG